MTQVKSNSGLVSFLLDLAKNKTEADTGSIAILGQYYSEIAELADKIARRGEASTRSVILAFWSEMSADGRKFTEQFKKLASIDKRTPSEEAQYNAMSLTNNNVNIALERACKSYAGVAFMRSIGIKVTFDKVQSSTLKNVWACYAKRDNEPDRVFFKVSQLDKIDEIKKSIKPNTKAVDLRAALTQTKQPKRKGGAGDTGKRLKPSEIKSAVQSLDSSLAAIALDAGGYNVASDTKTSLMMLWAQLDATLSDADKTTARDVWAKHAAEPTKLPPNIVKAVAKQVAGASK